ncbi:MAG: sigma-70 family RNA polymerase sigma factor [Planctomycetota bacterium]
MATTTIDGDELAWLHALARALVSVGESPEDLAQETALRAMELERPEDAPARPWLAAVMRGLRANRRRARSRQERRDTHRGARVEDPSTGALVERAETAEALAAAVRELPEPLRRTVLLRFIEGLDVAEIARREGSPPDTVRWRLRKGLEVLRERLVARSGRDWDWWSAALVPLARPSVPAAAPAAVGSIAVFTVMKWSFVAASLALVLPLIWLIVASDESNAGPEVERTVSATTPEEPEPGPVALDTVGQGRASALPESAVPSDAASGAQASDPTDADAAVFGIVLDLTGEPVPGATVSLIGPEPASNPRAVPRFVTEADGRFSFRERELPGGVTAALNVSANGFSRVVLERAVDAQPEGGWRVLLNRGERLTGRVVDPAGNPVPGLELAVCKLGMALEHVSASQRREYYLRSVVSPNSREDRQCIATTSKSGEVVFEGLASGEQQIVSLDPAWEIADPQTALIGAGEVRWTARPTLGVILEVIDGDGKPVSARATFNLEYTDVDGVTDKTGQWVGRGEEEVSFGVTPDLLGVEVAAVRFFGKIRVNDLESEWTSETLRELPGIARVRIELESLEPEVDEKEAAEIAQSKIETRPVVFDVRKEDGSALEVEALAIQWESRGLPGERSLRADSTGGGGLYTVDLPRRDLVLSVAQWNAQGSLERWEGTLAADDDGPVYLTLPVGGMVTILRPRGIEGIWRVRAQRGDSPDGPWRGGWNYGTDEDRLVLPGVDEGYWWFRINQLERFDDPLAAYVVEVKAGETVIVGE